jgi:hypothetical protein
VDKGFNDLELLESDKDLDSIRSSPQFASLLAEVKARQRTSPC